MSFTQQLNESTLGSTRSFASSQFEQKIQILAQQFFEKFKKHTRFYALFHIGFISFASVQLISFLLFFSFLSRSAILAFGLALFFLTVFSYFVLLFFFQAKKPQQFFEIRQDFATHCRSLLPFQTGTHEYHLPMANALHYFTQCLSEEELSYYSSAGSIKALAPLLEKFNIWLHWKNFLIMKELLQLLRIEELVHLVKAEPLDLEAHAALASAYSSLSKLYLSPKKLDPNCSLLWISPEYDSDILQQKFLACTVRAIEECKILNEFAPQDPWVHAQLADLYHHQGDTENEMKQYETLLQIAPSDKEIQLRLGILYFKQGYHANGLKMYELLKKIKDKKAEELIQYYDANQFYDIAYLSSSSK
jgi:tetratricopeptide (TPR) repeat protein